MEGFIEGMNERLTTFTIREKVGEGEISPYEE